MGIKKGLLCLTIACYTFTVLNAQHTFVVQNGTSTSLFESLTNAYNSANSGDTIYLPGGVFTVPTPVSKSLTWFGVGHYPDSTQATYFTQITNSVNFNGDTDGSTLTGIFFSNSISFGEAANNAENINLSRCRMPGITLKQNSDTTDIGFSITECVITSHIYANNSSNVTFEKNLVFGTINTFQNTHFDYNSINVYEGVSRLIRNCSNCLFTNNIFGYVHLLDNTNNCYFNNNLFQSTMNFPYGTNEGTNNITNVGWANFYQTITGNIYTFSYDNNYHLQTNNPTWATFSTDSTEPGIYGSLLPYKEGAVPINPHIRSTVINQKTTNGILPVQITVGAQDY